MISTEVLASRPAVRSASLAACLALLFAGATACGADGGASTSAKAGDRPHAATSIELANSARANERAYLQYLRREHHVATRQTFGYGDDHRQPSDQERGDGPATGQHAPGYDKALTAER